MFIDYGPELPQSYNEEFLYLMPVKPDSLFAYWEVKSDDKLLLQVCNNNNGKKQLIQVHPKIGSWYVNGVEPGCEYSAEIGTERDGKFIPICSSIKVTTPLKTIIPSITYRWSH